MKTFVTLNQIILKFVLFVFVSASGIRSQAQSLSGPKSDNSSVQPASASSVNLSPLTGSTTDTLVKITGHSSAFVTLQGGEQVTVVLNNDKVDLKWATDTEINVSHFVIEKSNDGKNFNDAGVVFAYGNTSGKTEYRFSDKVKADQPGVFYYVLRSVDNDGKSQYSAIRTIKTGK